MFYLAEAFNSDISSWAIQNVDTMASMLENATSFDQDLCAWSDNFPYNSAGDIFTSSGCTYADEPKCDELKLGPFCASFCPPTPDLCSPSAVRSIRFHACLLHPDVCFLMLTLLSSYLFYAVTDKTANFAKPNIRCIIKSHFQSKFIASKLHLCLSQQKRFMPSYLPPYFTGLVLFIISEVAVKLRGATTFKLNGH